MFFKDRSSFLRFGSLARRVRQHNTACIFDLIKKELAKVFEIRFTLLCIYNRTERMQTGVRHIRALYGTDHIGKFADTRRLDNNTIRREFFDNFFKCLCKIADKRTADTSRVHFRDFDSRFFKKSPVYTDLAEFVFDQNDFLADINLADKFFYERCFSCAQKTRKNINLNHNMPPI